MTVALAARLDLRPHLLETCESGAALVRAAVVEQFLAAVRTELGTLPYAPPPPEAQPAATACEFCILRAPLDGHPLLQVLRAELTARVRRAGAGLAGLASWDPDEIFVRRYARASTGLAPHRDGVRFLHLVATVTVNGSATFLRYGDADHPVQTWELRPGDLVLLRGAGQQGDGSDRPRHAVSGPSGGPRCSVAFRQGGWSTGLRHRRPEIL
jgi:hypothetical protein